MSFVVLKDQIKSVLEGISAIGQVEDYPTIDFQTYPAVSVRTDGNDSEYETTDDNLELYTFTLFLLNPLSKNTIQGVAKARRIMEQLCDTVRDTFDSNEFLNGISMPSGRAMMGIRPTVSQIFESENGKYITAEIELAIRVSKRN